MPPTTELGAGVTISSGPLEATFLPQLGMLGSSLRHRGEELLALPGGLDGYRKGNVTGLPLLAPWANRLGARRYDVDGIVVDLERLDLSTDEHGLPIHGTMTAQPGWELVAVSRHSLTARFAFGAHPDLMASFPFPHELRIEASVEATTLRVDTTLVPTGDRSVPVSFGYHPYLRLPDVDRSEWAVGIPARERLELDDRMLPTGGRERVQRETGRLGSRTFDDAYLAPERAAPFVLAGGDRRIELTLGAGYPFAQMYAPADDDVVAYEPMTAPTNALVAGGPDLPVLEPGGRYEATFSIAIT